ncbi:PDZ domain-containing protein [Trichostrongylus colubriformis]|uniref:PDZ domain-containing protein n=1 Tax=Trichostrongylus colubriformis TaxID=6319 RepID=A0AAN8G7T5_TRICO
MMAPPLPAPAMTPERHRNFVVRPGYSYFLVQINFTPGVKFGLGVKHYRNQVIVSKVDPGSMAAETLKVLDRICDVSSKPVTDKDVCRTLIVKSLKDTGAVDMVIERPVEPDALQAMENALNASKMQEPSVAMASDVKDILRRYNEKLQAGLGQMPAKKALSDPNQPRQNGRVNIDAGNGRSHISLIIGSDRTKSQQEQLQKVPPKPTLGIPRN